MSPSAIGLYIATILIWGSTWLGIKFQLGEVDPLVSVIYRFSAASLILFIWCAASKTQLRFDRQTHKGFMLQGIFMFGFNYWMVYWSEVYLTSGIVAVVFSTLVFFNAINGRIFLKSKINSFTLLGGTIGMVGVGLLFSPELQRVDVSNVALLGFGFALGSTFFASLGNIAATSNSGKGLPIMAVNAWGMLYGTATLTVIALTLDKSFTFPLTIEYGLSLLYLSIIGSIVAFGCYLHLIKQIGPDKAAYSSMLTPIVALLISTVYEDYQWTLPALLGVGFILMGNYLIMSKKAFS